MKLYLQSQWLLLFFCYSFLGWVWETCYVSLAKRRYVNRGFLHGPWLPIYGFGAVIILWLTLPVRENDVLVFFLGMAGATLLEYVTGAVMERLFHVRYWDYSNKPFNVDGHICLLASFAWGCFSVLLVELLHPPVERLILALPRFAADALGLVLFALFVVDATRSVQEALDLRALLENLAAGSEKLARLDEQLREALERFGQTSDALKEKLERLEENMAQGRRELSAAMEERRENRREELLRGLDERRQKKSRTLSLLAEKSGAAAEAVLQELENPLPEAQRARLEKTRELLLRFQASLCKAELDASARRDRDYQRAVSLIDRNPSAVSRQHAGAFQELFARKSERREKGQKEKGPSSGGR